MCAITCLLAHEVRHPESFAMTLNPTPLSQLLDATGRPSFLWDCDLSLSQLKALLEDPDEDVAAYWLGTTMRQARPDDALTLATPARMRALWPKLERYLGKERAFWAWLLPELERRGK
jgi:hypothetical protein